MIKFIFCLPVFVIIASKSVSVIGTAAVGVYELEKNGLRRAVMDAIEVATNKSKEISQTLSKQFNVFNEYIRLSGSYNKYLHNC